MKTVLQDMESGTVAIENHMFSAVKILLKSLVSCYTSEHQKQGETRWQEVHGTFRCVS